MTNITVDPQVPPCFGEITNQFLELPENALSPLLIPEQTQVTGGLLLTQGAVSLSNRAPGISHVTQSLKRELGLTDRLDARLQRFINGSHATRSLVYPPVHRSYGAGMLWSVLPRARHRNG